MDLIQAKKLFPVSQELSYLDHAAVSPIPSTAADIMSDYAETTSRTGAVDHQEFFTQAHQAKKHFARLINCKTRNVAFIKNTTSGILIASQSFNYRNGDNIITSALEFPGNIYPWVYSKGLEVKIAPETNGLINPQSVEELIDTRTKAISLSLVNYSTGGRNNLETIGRICRDKGILFIVDAIQAVGAIPVNVKELNADFLCADGHKWMLGPEGAGLMYVSDNALENCLSANVGWFSVENPMNFELMDQQLKPDAGRYEEGTLNLCGLLGLSKSLEVISSVGIRNVQNEIFALIDHLYQGLEKTGAVILSPMDEFHRSGILSFKMPKLDSGVIQRRFRAKRIVTAQRGNAIRVSPHFYNSIEDIDHLLDVLENIK